MPSKRSQVLAVLTACAAVLGAAAPAQAARPLKVVQLGDSYSAGNGAGSYYGPKDCYRSSRNWAERYLDTLRDEYNVSFVNRACSGGVLADLTGSRSMDAKQVNVFVPDETVTKDDPGARELLRQQGGCTPDYRDDESYSVTPVFAFPESGGTLVTYECGRSMEPQINAVGKDTDLVLFTIGGNDVKFADIIKQCFALGFRDPGDCRDKINAAQADIGGVGVRTAEFLRTLKQRMRPDAHIILVSYPYLEKDPGLTLRGGFLFLDNYAVGSEIRKLGDLGDAGQLAAMKAVNAEGGTPVTYIDTVKGAFAGHEPDGRVCCRNPDRWVHEFDTFTQMEWYHFNPTGHQEISKLLVQHPEFVASTRDVKAEGAVDIAFVIDTTGSMGSSIDSVKQEATQLVDDVAARTSGARFALVDYRDFAERTGDARDYPSRLDLDFTSDASTVNGAIQSLSLGYGGDTPETMYSGLMRAFDLSWRPGVKKLAIILADAPPLSPEPTTGLTAADVVDRSLAIDPVETHVIDVGSADDANVDEITSRTGGAVHASSDGNAAQEIADAIDASLDRPSAWAGGPYVAKIGDTLTLDGRGSYGVTSALTRWEWDFDSDGTYDVASAAPTVQRTFAAAYDGIVTLRVTDGGGGQSIATSVTHITRDGDEVPDATDTCPDVANPDQTDYDGDGLGDACDETQGYPDQDKPGVSDSGELRAAPGGGTTTGPVTPTPPGKQKPRPAADVRVTKPVLVRRGAALRMTVTCLRRTGTCAGTVRMKVGGKRVARRYRVKAKRKSTLTLTVPKAARTALRRGKRVAFEVAATTREGVTAQQTVRLKLPKRR